MKKILLFIIISIVTLSAPETSNNQNNDKSVAELQIQIKELEQKINKQNKEYLNLKKEVEERIGLTYNIDQIYSTSKSHYEESIKKVEELYSKSFENYNSLIIAFLTGLGILVAFAVFVKFDDSKKMRELRDELLCDMKYKKEEIEKYMDKIMETSISCMKEIVNAKTSELDDLKLKIEEMNKTLDKELIKLDNKIAEKIDVLKLESEKAIAYINNLSKEIKMSLDVEKTRISNHENEIKAVTAQIKKIKDFSSEGIGKNEVVNNINLNFLRRAKQLFEEKNYEESIVVLKENYSEKNYKINYWIGKNYQELGNYKEAIKYYLLAREYTKLKEEKYRLNYDIGISCYLEKNYIDALENFKIWGKNTTFIEEKDSAELWIGITNYTLGNYTGAVDILEKVKTSTKNYWLKSSYYEIAKKYYEEENKKLAQINILKSIEVDSEDVLALNLKEKIEKMPDSLDNKTEK